MSECTTISYAVDKRTDERVHVDEVEADYSLKHFLLVCEDCGAALIPKRGNERIHHFAHHFLSEPTERQRVCHEHSGRGGSGPSEWHRRWQSVFPKGYDERRLVDVEENEVKRADILIDDDMKVCIEFQKGEFGFDGRRRICKDRNDFWNRHGYKIVWLFEDTTAKNNWTAFNLKDNVLRIYKKYYNRLLGEDFIYDLDRIEIHITYNGVIYMITSVIESPDGHTMDAGIMYSYLNKYDPLKQEALPVPDVVSKIQADIGGSKFLAKKLVFSRLKEKWQKKEEDIKYLYKKKIMSDLKKKWQLKEDAIKFRYDLVKNKNIVRETIVTEDDIKDFIIQDDNYISKVRNKSLSIYDILKCGKEKNLSVVTAERDDGLRVKLSVNQTGSIIYGYFKKPQFATYSQYRNPVYYCGKKEWHLVWSVDCNNHEYVWNLDEAL